MARRRPVSSWPLRPVTRGRLAVNATERPPQKGHRRKATAERPPQKGHRRKVTSDPGSRGPGRLVRRAAGGGPARRYRSPLQTSSSVRPSTVRFSRTVRSRSRPARSAARSAGRTASGRPAPPAARRRCDRHACPREAISSGVSSRSTPCGITAWPGSSREPGAVEVHLDRVRLEGARRPRCRRSRRRRTGRASAGATARRTASVREDDGVRADQALVRDPVQVLPPDGVQGQGLPDGGLGLRVAVLPVLPHRFPGVLGEAGLVAVAVL
jgi:hypothetical protein